MNPTPLQAFIGQLQSLDNRNARSGVKSQTTHLILHFFHGHDWQMIKDQYHNGTDKTEID